MASLNSFADAAPILVIVSGRGSTPVTLGGGPIDTYVAHLDRALIGPRRVKADLMAEARDSLVDAAEAQQTRGLDRRAAERRAVAEFGTVDEIAAAFRTELGVAQARRTLVVFAAVLVPQPVVWAEGRWPWNSGEPAGSARPVVHLLDVMVESLGAAVMVGTVIALAACGIGLRWHFVRQHAARMTGLFVAAACVVMTLIGVVLTVVGNPTPGVGLLWLLVLLAGPLSIAGVAALRCFRVLSAPDPADPHVA